MSKWPKPITSGLCKTGTIHCDDPTRIVDMLIVGEELEFSLGWKEEDPVVVVHAEQFKAMEEVIEAAAAVALDILKQRKEEK